jgi:hypothetical protein
MGKHDKKQKAAPGAGSGVTDSDRLVARLKAEGLIRDPTPEELSLATEWDVLSEEEKQKHIRFMQSLALDPPLSQIIAENRR